MKVFIFILLFSLSNASVFASNVVHVAVASNFLGTLKSLAKDFTQQTGIKIIISNGATGMLYAQIKHGAPYDLFFSADSKRPQQLEQQGYIEAGSRFTYAVGKLVVWSKDVTIPPDLKQLKKNIHQVRFFAIANPKTAPYGFASVAVLNHFGLYKILKEKHKLALGENIGKAFQYVSSGNAHIGLVAKSYLVNASKPVQGNYVEINPDLYPRINQQAVILKGKNSKNVEHFLQFFHSDKVQEKIQSYGYGVINAS